MTRFRTCLLLLVTVTCPACTRDVAGPVASGQGDDSARPPLVIDFRQLCGPPEGREEAYDPETGVFHIRFKPRSNNHRHESGAFEVTRVAGRFTKPVVFRLTGVPSAYGCVGTPLALSVGDERYPMIDVGHDSFHAYERFDRTLFRVEREDDVVSVEFTEKGHSLLKPGARISFKVDTGW